MKTEVFGYKEGDKPSPEWLKQGFVVQWDAKTGKRQMWIWGFPKMNEEQMKQAVMIVLEDIAKS